MPKLNESSNVHRRQRGRQTGFEVSATPWTFEPLRRATLAKAGARRNFIETPSSLRVPYYSNNYNNKIKIFILFAWLCAVPGARNARIGCQLG